MSDVTHQPMLVEMSTEVSLESLGMQTENNMPVVEQTASQEPSWLKKQRRTIGAFVAGAVMLVSGPAVLAACNDDGGEKAGPDTTLAADQFEQNEACPETWEMPGVDHGEANKWFSDGIVAIKEAQTPEDARVAAEEWTNGSSEHLGAKHDDKLFVAGYNVLHRESISNGTMEALTTEGLIDESGCASDKMVQEVANFQAWVAASEVTVEDAPADWVNTGTDANGEVTIASQPGIGGDRKAIKIVSPDGSVTYIMGRCGQPVVPGKPGFPIPEGPTDNPENPPTTTPETPPTTSTIPMKFDDGRLPGNPNVPADQDKGTPDVPGQGPAGQTPNDRGYVPGETVPTAPGYVEPRPTTTPTTQPRPTASTSPQPTNTQPPQTATTSVATTVPQNNPRPTAP